NTGLTGDALPSIRTDVISLEPKRAASASASVSTAPGTTGRQEVALDTASSRRPGTAHLAVRRLRLAGAECPRQHSRRPLPARKDRRLCRHHAHLHRTSTAWRCPDLQSDAELGRTG